MKTAVFWVFANCIAWQKLTGVSEVFAASIVREMIALLMKQAFLKLH
jgi:hypothetical protein